MSYLPRMSATYKEPEALNKIELEELKPIGGIQPASSLVTERTFNPQIALKHYKYHPHPLPVLPGPSVTDEANEMELRREASRLRKSLSKIDEVNYVASRKSLDSTLVPSEDLVIEPKTVQSVATPTPVSSSKRVNAEKTSKVSLSKKKGSKGSTDKKKESHSKQLVNICLVETNIPDSFVSPQTARPPDSNEVTSSGLLTRDEINNLRRENTDMPTTSSNPFKRAANVGRGSKEREDALETVHRSVQCNIFGSLDKTYVIPMIINILLKLLAFLLHEINKDEVLSCTTAEGKRIMTQVQLILGDLCNQTVEKDFSFDVTYSDSKRVEKLLEELQKYLKNTYGTKGDLSDITEGLKKIYLQLKMKEFELSILNEKIQEGESLRMIDAEVKENDLKNPEVTLQNKRLESEQLIAEVEFSRIEMVKYQKALAEVEWDIKIGHDKISSMKKSSGSKSKTDILGRKPSVLKFSTEASRKGTRGKDLDDARSKKKI